MFAVWINITSINQKLSVSQQPHNSIELSNSLPNTFHFFHASKVNNSVISGSREKAIFASCQLRNGLFLFNFFTEFFLQFSLTIKYFITQSHVSAPSWGPNKMANATGIFFMYSSMFHLLYLLYISCWCFSYLSIASGSQVYCANAKRYPMAHYIFKHF